MTTHLSYSSITDDLSRIIDFVKIVHLSQELKDGETRTYDTFDSLHCTLICFEGKTVQRGSALSKEERGGGGKKSMKKVERGCDRSERRNESSVQVTREGSIELLSESSVDLNDFHCPLAPSPPN